MWVRLARIRRIEERIQRIQASRLAGAEDKHYVEFMHGLANDLRKVVHGDEKVVKENWEALRRLGKKR